MAQRWTIALILICLTVPTALIAAFRVRDLAKSSHDSVKKQEKCDNCDVKFAQKWHIDKIESGKYSKAAIKGNLQDQQQPNINIEEKSSNNEEEDDDDNEDFSFLKFKTGFIQEYPKEAFSKLEQKLDAISKSFWNLFGDGSVDEVNEKNDEENDDDEDDDSVDADDDYEHDDEDEQLKIPSAKRKSKILDVKKKFDEKAHIKNDAVPQVKFKNLKFKSETLKRTAYELKPRNSLFSEEDESNDDETEEKTSVEKIQTTIKDLKKKISTPILQSPKPSLSKETSEETKYEYNKEKIDQNKNVVIPKPLVTKSNVKLKSLHKMSSKNERRNDEDFIDDISDEDKYSDEQEDDKVDADEQKSFSGSKESSDIQENYKLKDIESYGDVKQKQNPKETKSHTPLNFKPLKDIKRDENDSIKGHKKILEKSQPHNIHNSKEVSKVEDDDISIKATEAKSNENSMTLHKSKEVKDDEIKEKPIYRETFKMKVDERFTFINNEAKNIKSVKNQEVEQSNKKEAETKKEPLKITKTLDDNKAKIKHIQENKIKSHDTIKITKSSEIPKQKLKEDAFGSSLEKSATKVKKDKQKKSESVKDFVENIEVNTKSESNLQHITEALHRRSLHKSEFEDFYTFIPTFAPNFSRVHNPECRRHGQILLRQLRGTKLWALNMLDATAKIPSGLLQGNGIQLGDFEQCLVSRARVQLDTGSVVKIQGKYCLAWVDVKAEHPDLETPVHLAQAKNLIKSRVDDPGHFVPRFSTLSWGVCVPSPCEPEDVEAILRDAIRHYQRTSGMVLRIKVNEKDCHVAKGADWWEKWLELPTVLTLSFYGIILMLVCVATIQDFVSRRKPDEHENAQIFDKAENNQKETKSKKEDPDKQSDDLLSIFSLYHTMKKLIAPGSTDDISCVHGVRAIATIALLVAHKFFPVAAMPYTNRLYITDMVSSPLWSWCRAGWIFTDCFLLLSGALSAYHICTDSDTGLPKRLLSRYLRLTPALFAVVLFYAYIWDNISTGPMWGTFVTKNAQLCQEGWWWNLLYVQNYFGMENMCAPQTHQLALDMQLTVLGGVIVWLGQEKRGFVKLLLPAVHVFAAYSRYSTVRDHRLTLLAYRGVSVSQLYRTARLSYTSVLHRSTPYLFGISLGLALKKRTQHGKFVFTVGWIVNGVLWSLVWWAGFDSGTSQYRYNVTSAAQYAALTPVASALAISWIIYAVHNGCSEFLSNLLSCRPLVLISRLSYAIYLCQFIMFITSIGTVRTSSEFTVTTLINIQEISVIILTSVIITLTLVIPMQSLPKFIFQSKVEASETKTEKADSKIKSRSKDFNRTGKDEKETQQIKHIQKILVHREVLKEIPEVEIEYEAQRDRSDILEGILEEEENEEEIGDEEESQNQMDEDLVIVEEQGDEQSWGGRENNTRYYSRDEDNELDEWEWTANGRNSAQYLRYSR